MDRLDEMEITPLQRVLLSRLLGTQCHNHPKFGGYVEFLRWYALAHYDMEEGKEVFGNKVALVGAAEAGLGKR